MMHEVSFFHKQGSLPGCFLSHIAQLVRLAHFCLCFSHEKFPNVHCTGICHCGEEEGENHHNGSIGIKDKGTSAVVKKIHFLDSCSKHFLLLSLNQMLVHSSLVYVAPQNNWKNCTNRTFFHNRRLDTSFKIIPH